MGLRGQYGIASSKSLASQWLDWGVPPSAAFFGKLGCMLCYRFYGERNNEVFRGLERDCSDVWSLVKFCLPLCFDFKDLL